MDPQALFDFWVAPDSPYPARAVRRSVPIPDEPQPWRATSQIDRLRRLGDGEA